MAVSAPVGAFANTRPLVHTAHFPGSSRHCRPCRAIRAPFVHATYCVMACRRENAVEGAEMGENSADSLRTGRTSLPGPGSPTVAHPVARNPRLAGELAVW